jgi:hypothetical protein
VAKKRKGARTTGSPRPRKRTSTRAGARKKAPRRTAVSSAMASGLENPREVNLTPLKKQLSAHIERLRRVKTMSSPVQQTLDSLERTYAELKGICGLSMVIEA